ncbi:MAG TPA: HrpJ domain-containing protein, partial [Syntrophales bacterium]|nr:HrpJ domain-containing protein [Syntrophales bacterium]
MSGGIVGEVTTGQGLQRTGEPETRGAEGEYRGRKVVHRIDVRSLIAEAAEEISFSFSERVEKTLPGRKIIPKSGRMTRAMERAWDHLARLPDLENTERLQEFLELLKSRGEWTLPGILRDARSFFRDVSHRHAGLSFAREMLEGEEGFEALRDGVGKALGTLEA